ncbi:MAG: hypothetical protein HZC12_01105 [Nitrospirae bacterium]|nr:hypothetical protein [Nitrospirota bacterium]
MEERLTPFHFEQCISILKSTGKKARNLRELRKIISEVSDESIFHHTYQYFLKGHILEYTNDFAHWAGESLEEKALSEHLSNIDPYAFASINDLRNELLRVIDEYLKAFPEPRLAMKGDEFYFNETVTIIFPTNVIANNLAEFLVAIRHIDAGSIYFHFYEARMRLGKEADDFTRWIEDTLGKKELASEIRNIDLFMFSIEGIRNHIAGMVEAEVKKDMGTI